MMMTHRGGLLALLLLAATADAQDRPFRIRAVDDATGRGVPLVELETVHHVLYVTDSAGVAAIEEPGLMGREVWFEVRSHGYEFPADGFGYRGIRPALVPGGSVTVRMRRVNVAERLYRVTGQGIYRDSVLLGDSVPIREPLLAGGVLGQDSVCAAVYRGRVHWFWGDTNRAGYPLGQFATSGAVSDLPGKGGLDPAIGIDLAYWVDDDGFSRKMCPLEGPGPVWIGGLMVLEEGGRERMVAHYSRMRSLEERLERGIAIWDDETERFVKAREWPLDAAAEPAGHPFLVEEAGERWFLFTNPYPALRVRARLEDVLDPARYEAFTCLEAGSKWDPERPPVERAAGGQLVWGWKRDAPAMTAEIGQRLMEGRVMGPSDGWLQLTDVETGKPIRGHGGSVAWNEHRRRWVMIALESWGRSMLGEVWYAEGDTPLGPWVYARRIVTHDDYSFYNVKHHPFFDQDGGRLLYFEGTYTATFSGNRRPTPRYDYNQMLYRLDLDDDRLHLPVPIYETAGGRLGPLEGQGASVPRDATVPFFALPPDRQVEGAVAVRDAEGRVLFHVLPEGGEAADHLVLLYQWRRGDEVRHAPDAFAPGEGWTRADRPVGRVWRSPRTEPLSPGWDRR